MENIYRTLYVHGHAVAASGQIKINHEVTYSGPIVGPVLYHFTTDVSVHGNYDIEIILNSGYLVIEKVEAMYPAIINQTTLGYYTLTQPIEQPFIDLNTKQSLNFPISVKDKFQCKHLMFNGPHIWNITVDEDVTLYPGINIHQTIATSAKVTWGYDNVRFGLDSNADLLKLINW